MLYEVITHPHSFCPLEDLIKACHKFENKEYIYLLTSATTSKPKIVVHKKMSLIKHAQMMVHFLDLNKKMKWGTMVGRGNRPAHPFGRHSGQTIPRRCVDR